eukprot:scpid34564/ scgid8550/ 
MHRRGTPEVSGNENISVTPLPLCVAEQSDDAETAIARSGTDRTSKGPDTGGASTTSAPALDKPVKMLSKAKAVGHPCLAHAIVAPPSTCNASGNLVEPSTMVAVLLVQEDYSCSGLQRTSPKRAAASSTVFSWGPMHHKETIRFVATLLLQNVM